MGAIGKHPRPHQLRLQEQAAMAVLVPTKEQRNRGAVDTDGHRQSPACC